MQETSDPTIRDRLDKILTFKPDAKIELELQFSDGRTWDSDEQRYTDNPPSVYVIVQAIHTKWINLPLDRFDLDEVPLLVGDMAEDDLFVQTYAEALEDHEKEQEKLRLEMSESRARLQIVMRSLYVYSFIIVDKQGWKPVACGRSTSFRTMSVMAGKAGYPHHTHAVTAVHPSVFQEMTMTLLRIGG